VALRKVGLAVYEVEDSDQFSGTIESVQGKLEEQAVARKEQLTENEDLRKKLLGLLAQFDQQQGAFDQQLKTKDLELQLAEARWAQQTALADQARAQASAFEHNAATLAKSEAGLREQLALYAGKFDTFQHAIETSNAAFKDYRAKLEELNKGKLRSEREAALLRHRAEGAEAKLAKSVEGGKELVSTRAQKVKLEKLCRTLQTERASRVADMRDLQAKLTPAPPLSGAIAAVSMAASEGGKDAENVAPVDVDAQGKAAFADSFTSPAIDI